MAKKPSKAGGTSSYSERPQVGTSEVGAPTVNRYSGGKKGRKNLKPESPVDTHGKY